jgi:hypothetical protein
MAQLDDILFSRELCIVHDCLVYELLSFDVLLCENQLIRAKISFQCLHMISEQYYTYAHEHIALLSYKSCINFRMVRPQKKLPTW